MNSIVRRTALLAAPLLLLCVAASASPYRDEFHKTYPVSPNVQVSLNNINGSVQITAWDRNELQLDAVKTADSQEKLQEAEIRVDASQNSIRIETHYPERTNNNPASVEYQLHVPRAARLDKIDLVNGKLDIDGVRGEIRGASVNGNITAHGLSSDADLSTVNGAVSGELLDMASAHHVKLSSVNGHVEIAMPKDANAHLSANTVCGHIDSDLSLPIHKGWVGSDLDTTLGSGATRIELSNVNGSIKIHGANAGS